ncbi:MAG: hypothetical protein WKG07_43470 [Hymenobacter sp.]
MPTTRRLSRSPPRLPPPGPPAPALVVVAFPAGRAGAFSCVGPACALPLKKPSRPTPRRPTKKASCHPRWRILARLLEPWRALRPGCATNGGAALFGVRPGP